MTTHHPSFTDSEGRPCVTSIIDGKSVPLPGTASFAVRSAAESNRVVHHAQSATIEVAVAAVESAAAAFQTYKRTTVADRRKMLLKAASLFERQAAEAARRQVLETSCEHFWATLNVQWVVDTLRELAGSVATAVVGEIPPSGHGCTSLVFKEPVGTVLIIPP